MISALVVRMSRRMAATDGPNSASFRTEVCPPSMLPEGDSMWMRFSRWLRAPAPLGSRGRRDPLAMVREEFVISLRDIRTGEGCMLTLRIQDARSLRDLWHLRPAMFSLIAVHHSQYEADQRLAQLNRHFPTRAPRSGFAPLDA
jgi:hypothetical protein